MVTQEQLEDVLVKAASVVAQRDELEASAETVSDLVDCIALMAQLICLLTDDYNAVFNGADGMITFFAEKHPAAFREYLLTLEVPEEEAQELQAIMDMVDTLRGDPVE